MNKKFVMYAGVGLIMFAIAKTAVETYYEKNTKKTLSQGCLISYDLNNRELAKLRCDCVANVMYDIAKKDEAFARTKHAARNAFRQCGIL